MKDADLEVAFPCETVREGRTRIIIPKLTAFVTSVSEYAPSKAPVFYNPVMELNRDVAVLAFQAYQRSVNHEIDVSEPLAGSGVMGLRFASEVEGIRTVRMTDINKNAFKLSQANIDLNQMAEKVTIENQDANAFLGNHGAPHERFDAIDIDPFGSPVPYLDATIRALRNDGLVAATATDMAPLCGVHSKACRRKYEARPMRTEYCRELALRILAGCLARTAAKYDMGMRVVFSHSTSHYVRVYGTFHYGAKRADESLTNIGYLLHCFNCSSRKAVKVFGEDIDLMKCDECGANLDCGGPLWLGELSSPEFCDVMQRDLRQRALKQAPRLQRMLELVKNESNAPVSYFVIDKLCKRMKLPVPAFKKLIEILCEKGFKAVPTHFDPLGIKTNASSAQMQRILSSVAGESGKS